MQIEKTFILLILAVIIAGCAKSDLHPEHGPGMPVGRVAGVYEGYALPYDVFNDNVPIFFLSNILIFIFYIFSGKSRRTC